MNLIQLVTHLQKQANVLKQTPSNAQSVSNFYKSIENLLYQTYDQELSNKHITSNEHFVLDKKTFNGIPVSVQSSGIGLGKKTVIATISYGKYLSNKLQNTVAYLQSLMQKDPSHSARYQQQITSLQPELSQINPQLYYRRVAVRKNNVMIPTHLHTLSKQDVLQFINQAINVISFINKRGADQSQLNQLQKNTNPINRQSLFQPTNVNQTPQTQVKPKKKSHHFSLFHKNKKSKSKSHKNHGGFFNKMKQFGSYMNSRPSESSSNLGLDNATQNNNASVSTNTANMNNYNPSSQFAQSTVNTNLGLNNQETSQSKTFVASSSSNLDLNLTSQSSNESSSTSNKYKPLTNTLNNTKYNPNLNSFEMSSQSSQSNLNAFDTLKPKSIAFSPAQSSNVDDESLYDEYQSSKSAKSSLSASMSTSVSLSASISSASVSTSQSLSNSYSVALSVKTSIAVSQEHAKMSSAYDAKKYATSMNSSLRHDMSNMDKHSNSSMPNSNLNNNIASKSVTNMASNDNASESRSFNYQEIANALKKSKSAKSSASIATNSQSVSTNDNPLASDTMSSTNSKLHSLLNNSSAQPKHEMHGSAVAILAQVDLENKSIRSACSSEVASVGAQNNSLINKMQLRAKGFASAKSSLISSASSVKASIKGSAELASYQQNKASSNTAVVLKASASSKYTSLASLANSNNKSMATSIISRAQDSVSSANSSAISTVASTRASASTFIHSLSNSNVTKLTSVQASATSVSKSASSVARSFKSNHDTLTYIINSQKHQVVFYKQMVHYMNKYYQAKIDNMLQPALDSKNMHDSSINLIRKIGKTHNFNWLTAKKFSNYKDFLQFMNRYRK